MLNRDNSPRIALIAIGLLTILYVAIRLTYLDRMVTVDEQHWLGRSANFYRALRTGDWNETYQMAHPGVMTMWAGTIAYWIHFPDYYHAVPDNVTRPGYILGTVFRDQGVEPLDILQATRIAKVLLQSLFFLGSLVFVRTLFGLQVAIVAGIMIVFDPFLSGLDSLMHVDGMFAITTTCAILSLGWAWQEGLGRTSPWVISGAIAATSWLSRAQGGLVPALAGAYIGGVLIYRFVKQRRNTPAGSIMEPARAGLAWIGSWALTSIILWPALWSSPVAVYNEMKDFYGYSASEGHGWGVFFNGEIVFGDPGMLFYPATVIWRLTPVTLVGIGLFLGLLRWARRSEVISSSGYRCLGMLLSFSVVFTIIMSLSAKKFDRYLLAIYPALDIIAACGFVMYAGFLVTRSPMFFRRAFAVIASIVLVVQGLSTASAFPYRLDYYNVLLGGATEAQYEMQMGWGEGADQVLGYLKINTPRDTQVTVVPSMAFSAIDWLDTDPESRLKLDVQYELLEPHGWYEADYFVHGIQAYQRNMRGHNYFMSLLEPVHVVYVEGVEFYKIYRPNLYPAPDWVQAITACTMDFAPGIRLLQVWSGDDAFDFYFVTTADVAPDPATFTITTVGKSAEGVPIDATYSTVLVPGAPNYLSKLSVPFDSLAGIEIDSVDSFELSAVRNGSLEQIPVSKPGDLTSAASGTVAPNCWSRE
jgi:hypothetical protein